MVDGEVVGVDVDVDVDVDGAMSQGDIRRSEEEGHQPTEEMHRAAREQSPSMDDAGELLAGILGMILRD